MDTIALGKRKTLLWSDFPLMVEMCFIFASLLGFTAGTLLYKLDFYNSFNSVSSAELSGWKNDISNSGAQPKPVFPPDNYITSSILTPDIFYTWKNPVSNPVIFQIASRPDFSGALVVEQKLSGTAAQGRFLPPGIYYWRVVENLFTFDSQPMRLVVLENFSAPECISPYEGENIRIAEGIPVDFRWEKLNYADTYDFKLFSASGGAPIYEVSSLRDTVVQAYFNPLTAGRYRWTVQANVESMNEVTRKRGLIKDHFFSIGRPGAEPVPGFVRGVIKAGAVHAPITLLAPWTGASIAYDHLSPDHVRWSIDENYKNTRVFFSRDLDPASDPRAVVLSADEGITSVPIPDLNEGIWYWIVQGDTPGNNGLSAAAPSWFTILPPPPLDVPRYVQPVNEAVLTLEQLTADRSIKFE